VLFRFRNPSVRNREPQQRRDGTRDGQCRHAGELADHYGRRPHGAVCKERRQEQDVVDVCRREDDDADGSRREKRCQEYLRGYECNGPGGITDELQTA
jgi:hypothetical protein